MQEPLRQSPADSYLGHHALSEELSHTAENPTSQKTSPFHSMKNGVAGLGRDETELVSARAGDAPKSRPCAGATRRRGGTSGPVPAGLARQKGGTRAAPPPSPVPSGPRGVSGSLARWSLAPTPCTPRAHRPARPCTRSLIALVFPHPGALPSRRYRRLPARVPLRARRPSRPGRGPEWP